jgi:flagellar biosynthesis/type III secretory pathway ATPase
MSKPATKPKRSSNYDRARQAWGLYFRIREIFDAGHYSSQLEAAMFDAWTSWVEIAYTLRDAEAEEIETETRAERRK